MASDPELVDHTAYTMLVDRSGEGRVIYDASVKAKDVVHDVDELLSLLGLPKAAARPGLHPASLVASHCLRSYGTRVMRFCGPGPTGELCMK